MSVAILLILTFLVTVTAIRPVTLGRFAFNMATMPVLAGFLLLTLPDVSKVDLLNGLLGNEHLQPWNILVIFFAIAYIAISADKTGLFEYISYNIIRKVRGNGTLLFFAVYALAGCMTIFTSNDIVILTLTPIILYLGTYARLNVLPLLFAEFFAAHTFSMFLLTGDPTNIIVGMTLGLDFLSFFRVMVFPTIVAVCVNIAVLWLLFRKTLTQTFLKNKKGFVLTSPVHALLSASLLVVLLLLFGFSETMGYEIWQVALMFAGIFFIKDAAYSAWSQKNRISEVGRAVPWRILPFIAVLFILVHLWSKSLFFAKVIAFTSDLTPIGALAVFGIIGAVLSNIMNNQPMTIFLTQVILDSTYVATGAIRDISAYALVIASNVGATITLIGALAGIMWHRLLRDKGVQVSYMDFVKIGSVVGSVTLFFSLGVLFLVLQ